MTTTQPHIIFLTRLLVAGLLGFLSFHAQAEQPSNIFKTQVHIDSDGLAIQQPIISQTEILQTLTQAHRLLSAQGQKAKTVVDEHNAEKNMVVAAIMPGGLIYLAYQQSKMDKAQITLANVANELEDLDADAVTLYKPVYNTIHQPILVARYP